MGLFDSLYSAQIPGQQYLSTPTMYTASDDLNKLRRLITPIFEKVGWSSTVYIINFNFFEGIREFQPPAYFLKALSEGTDNYSEGYNRKTQEIYSENYSSPVGRIYNTKVDINQQGGYNPNGNSNTDKGSITFLRDDFIKLMRLFELDGGLENAQLQIIEIIGTLSSNPLYDSLTIYEKVKPGIVRESNRTQGQLFYTASMELFFTHPPKIYSLTGVLGDTLSRFF